MDVDLPRSLRESGLIEARSALAALEQGGAIQIWDDKPVDVAEYITTYTGRSEHLSEFHAEHPRRLKRSTDEMLVRMKAHSGPTYTATIQDASLGAYVIWLCSRSGTLLGCSYTIGKHEVSAREWEKLWGR